MARAQANLLFYAAIHGHRHIAAAAQTCDARNCEFCANTPSLSFHNYVGRSDIEDAGGM